MAVIRMPVLMDGEMAEAARLAPTALQVDFKLHEVSQATMTLPEDGPTVNLHDWITLYGPDGSWGVWRVTNIEQTLKRQRRLTLMHGIDILADSLWEPEEAGAESETFTGNTGAFLSELLSKQTHLIDGLKPWALRDCESQEMINGKEISYDTLADLLQGVAPAEGDYYLEYDMSVFPWRVALRAKPTDTACEFRLARNITSCAVTYNDADLCTRLVLSVTSGGSSQVRIYTAGAAAEAEWGVVTKPASIDTHDDLSAASWPEAEAWVRAFFAQHAQPTVQIQIEGRELARLTGDSWDRASLGKMCRVALPDYGHTFAERVVAVTYPDPLRDPDRVTVSLANTLPSFTDSIRIVQRTASGAAGSARKNKQTLDNYSVEFETEKTRVRSTVTAIGVVLNPDGSIATDPATGEYIFSPDSKVNLTSQIIQNAGDISSTVTRTTNLEGRVTTAESRISQTDNAISLVVTKRDGTNVVNSASIVAQMNADKSSLALSADAISLTTGTKLTDVLYISNGGSYFNGTSVNATLITGGSVTGDQLYIKSGSGSSASYQAIDPSSVSDVQIIASGSGYKLQKKTWGSSSWTDAGTFSRAVTITGAWSNGRYTVSASQGTANSLHTDISVSGGNTITYNGTFTYKVMYEDAQGDDQETGATKTITVNVPADFTGDDVDINGDSSDTPQTVKPTTSVTRGKTSISGYVWGRLSDGKWHKLRSISISNGAKAMTNGLWSKDEYGNYYKLSAGHYYC